MDEKQKIELGIEVASEVRAKTLQALEDQNVTIKRIARVLSIELKAFETKAFLDKKSGKVVYSRPMLAHGPRLKAAELSIKLLDMNPAEKHEVKHGFDEPLIEIVRKLRAEKK
jgi:hypothetical protein